MNKRPKKLQNVLPNNYIPVLSKKVILAILAKHTKETLIEFMELWPSLINTQPHLKSISGHSQESLNKQVKAQAVQFRKEASKMSKRKIIEKIVFEYWWKGLNLLQFSQLDCQLIVEHSNSFSWECSTVLDSFNEKVPLSLSPQTFLKSLAHDLSMLFLSYTYVCRHPNLPSIIIRIQVFDLNSLNATQSPHIVSRKPFYLAIPLNSPHIIHSMGNDVIGNIVLQTVEKCIPQSSTNLLRISRSEKSKPVRSLETMHLLFGCSRFGNSLGIWSRYADGSVDMLPLGPLEIHESLNSNSQEFKNNEDNNRKIANLRFKGSIYGSFKSEKFFDDNRERKRRKATIASSEHDSNAEVITEETVKKVFTSIAPIQYSNFELKDQINGQHTSISMKLVGTDIFAGLHELSVSTSDIIDPATMPSWLTGEDRLSNGIVKDGIFYDQ